MSAPSAFLPSRDFDPSNVHSDRIDPSGVVSAVCPVTSVATAPSSVTSPSSASVSLDVLVKLVVAISSSTADLSSAAPLHGHPINCGSVGRKTKGALITVSTLRAPRAARLLSG